jgi:hypothetical protein
VAKFFKKKVHQNPWHFHKFSKIKWFQHIFFLTFIILIHIQGDATLHSLFYLETALHVRVVPPPILRSANNCIYSIWYLSHHNCYLLLLWKSWNWFECAVGDVCRMSLILHCASIHTQNRTGLICGHTTEQFNNSVC